MKGYNTLSDNDKKEMLETIGVGQIMDLYEDVPSSLFFNGKLNLPTPLTEWQLEDKLTQISNKNKTVDSMLSFIGGGYYHHYVPAVVDAIVNRGEYLTSYTPYQPEVSQGLLQALYEYQIVISKLTGLPIVNSSCYDGATALADAASMSCAINQDREDRILIAASFWGNYQKILNTYTAGRGINISQVAFNPSSGQIDLVELESMFKTNPPAGFMFQSPNAFGILENVDEIAKLCQQYGVISTISTYPLSIGLTHTPGGQGIDIVTGEAQSLGIHLNAGGSSLGFFSTRREYRKFVPGRIVGMVTDINSNLAYSLIDEDREQHIAREKATSNICSNQALNAIRTHIYLTCLGENGFRKIAKMCAVRANYLRQQLMGIEGIELAFTGPIFNEFVVKLPMSSNHVLNELSKLNIFAGLNYDQKYGLENALLINVTELKKKQEIDTLVSSLRKVL